MLKPHRASLILTFGILGLILCQLLGIAAWSMGNNDLQQMDRGWMDPSGRDLTNTGRTLGMVGTGILALQSAIAIVVLLMLALAHK